MKKAFVFLACLLCSAPTLASEPVKLANKTTAPAFGDFTELKDRRLRVLVPLSRSNFYIDSGLPRGRTAQRLDILSEAVAPVKVDYILTPQDRLLDDLRDGRGDVAAGGIEVDPNALKTLDFSNHVMELSPDVIVTHHKAPAVRSISDLSNRRIYVREDSRAHQYLRDLNAELISAGQSSMTIVLLPGTLADEDLLDMLNAEMIEATVTSERLARFWARPLPKIRPQEPLPNVTSAAEFVWAFRQESPELAEIINNLISTFDDPDDDDVARWAANARKLQNNRSPAAMARLEKALPHFEKHGAAYNLDPLVIAAVGYQESRLNQNARGSNGFTGIMQMRAVIAKQMKSGPVTEFASNIEGGAKYLNYLANHLFQDSKPDRLNRSLIAAAAYNLGPRPIREARARAREMGLNPDVWFDNLELAAMTRSGLRPVLYVRDIYKYYVAYEAEFALRAQKK